MEKFTGGERLRDIRKEQNLTRRAVAFDCKITETTLFNWESGKAFPRLDLFVKLAKVYGYDPGELLKEVTQ